MGEAGKQIKAFSPGPPWSDPLEWLLQSCSPVQPSTGGRASAVVLVAVDEALDGEL